MLEVRGLSKSYNTLPALHDLSFNLQPGQVLGCLGPNGSGKSTTVRILMGLLQPTRGEVRFRGTDINHNLAAYKKQVGYVPEEANLYPYLSGREYLEIVGALRGMDSAELNTKIDNFLELFSLSAHRHATLGSYSKGMRQRILLIAAIMDDPDLLIFDEPLSGLDVVSALIFKNLIKALGAEGKAIFYCSHVLEVVEQVCSHLLILNRGTVIANCAADELHRPDASSSLERTFASLVQEVDPEKLSRDIIQVMAGSHAC